MNLSYRIVEIPVLLIISFFIGLTAFFAALTRPLNESLDEHVGQSQDFDL